MTEILIIGADSFIGKYLFKYFKNNNYDVIGTCFKKNHEEFLFLDIFESTSYINIFQKYQPEIIISLAWNTSQGFWNSELNKLYYEAYLNLIRKAFESKIEFFIGMGSSAEYGELNFNCRSSNTLPNPTTLYGYYKLQAAIELMKMSSKYNSNYLWLRLFQVYGNGEKDFRLIPTLINLIESNNNQSLVIKNPNKILDWIHVTDVVEALIFLLKNNFKNEIIDVGTSIGNSVAEIIKKIEYLYDAQLNLKFQENNVVKGLVCSSSIKLLETGWYPKLDLVQGLKGYKEEF